MANIYEIKKQFDDALVSAGYAVNDGTIESTDDLTDGIKAYTFVNGIEQASEQVGQHLTIEFTYNLQSVRADSDITTSGVETRNIQAGTDFEAILAVLYQRINGTNTGEQITLVDGTLSTQTEKDYQSWGSFSLNVQHKFRVYS